MGIIKALKLGFDYQRYDDDGNVVDMQRAVNDVDLDIKAGEFVAVLGHNGSGKSTLAKHMNALLIPTEGTMLVTGSIPPERPNSGRYARRQEWYFRIRITRS